MKETVVVDTDRTARAAALKTALPHLAKEDLDVVLETAAMIDVPDGTVVIEEGSRYRGLIAIISGSARVMRGQNRIAFATMSAGELIGEVAFLDQEAASATVVAERSLRMLRLDESQLNSLLHSVPGLASRLYQSLACSLAKRLRTRTELMPPFTVEEVPQVHRFHTMRAAVAGEVPVAFVEAVEEFKRTMLHAQIRLKTRDQDIEVVNATVTSACAQVSNVLGDYVRDRRTAEVVGSYAFRETFPFMMSSALLERVYVKPRGYAGDFETIETIYSGSPVGASAIGLMIDGWAQSAETSQAVRNRRSKLINDIGACLAASQASESLSVTSLAIGPGREIFDILDLHPSASLQFTGIDIDDAALRFCADQARGRGIDANKLVLFQDNLIKLSLGRGRVSIPEQNFVYSMGLIDYLEDRLIVQLISWAFEQLAPGGTLALGNFATGNPYKPFMDHIVEWVLIHRTPDEMRELFARSKFGKTEVCVDVDPTGIQLFAYCTKQ